MYFSYTYPTYVEFGERATHRIGPISKSKGCKRILVITDPGIVKSGLIEPVVQSMEENRIEYVIFDGVEPNPKDTTVEAGLRILKEEGCDSVAAVGGGSSIDVGKVVSMLATNGGDIRDYEIRSGEDIGAGKIKEFPLPLFTIPTTAGTGSEINFWAVITDTSRKFKMLIGQPPLVPGGPYMGAICALVDPLMTLSLPPKQTAATGIDAFFHAVEVFISPATPPILRPIALNAAELVVKWLPKAYKEGENKEAREKMMLAAHMGGICINFGGLGAIHALGEAIGGVYEYIPHGCALAAVAPNVLRYNSSVVTDKYFDLERRMHPENARLTCVNAPKMFIETVSSLIATVDLPQNLRSLGVKFESLYEIADKASKAIEMSTNPRKAGHSDLLEILKESF